MRKKFGWLGLTLLGTLVCVPSPSQAQTSSAPAQPATAAPAPAESAPATPPVAVTAPAPGAVAPPPAAPASEPPAPTADAVAAPSALPSVVAPPLSASTAPAAPAALPAQGKKGKKDKKGKKPAWKKKPDVTVGGFVHALYVWQSGADLPNNEFRLRNARLHVDWSQGKLLEGQLSFDLGDDEQTVTAFGPLRDAYVEVKPLDALELRAGQFKRPFGRLESISLAKLRLIERGVANAWLVQELRYGDRDLGAQVSGHFGKLPRLNYAAGIFNGTGRNRSEDDLNGSKDLVARVDADLTKWLNVGFDASHKRFDRDVHPGYPDSALVGGADFAIHVADLRVIGEAMYGDNYLSLDEGNSWSALLLASYEVPLTRKWGLALEPLVKGEVVKIEDQLEQSQIWVGTAGANLHIAKYYRLMLQGELIRPKLKGEGDQADRILPDWPRENRLLVQAAMRMP
ncbi:MAG: hypothetical protein JW940_32175 [Polyangiaceae bacterium]|nr:hypothetical protein [Polyangiaceae bacterium]